MLLIVLKQKFGDGGRFQRKGEGSWELSAPQVGMATIFLVWISSLLALDLLEVIFVCLLILSASSFFLFQSKCHDTPKFYHTVHLHLLDAGLWLCWPWKHPLPSQHVTLARFCSNNAYAAASVTALCFPLGILLSTCAWAFGNVCNNHNFSTVFKM